MVEEQRGRNVVRGQREAQMAIVFSRGFPGNVLQLQVEFLRSISLKCISKSFGIAPFIFARFRGQFGPTECFQVWSYRMFSSSTFSFSDTFRELSRYSSAPVLRKTSIRPSQGKYSWQVFLATNMLQVFVESISSIVECSFRGSFLALSHPDVCN